MPYYIFSQEKRGLVVKRDRRYPFEIEKENGFWSVKANTKEKAIQEMQSRIRRKNEEEQNRKGSTVSASSMVKTVDQGVKREVTIPLKIVKQVEPEIQAA